ncbi:MAG: MFS transporter [Oscillospiraceae bacterium]|nr:MFS transporter [Oscillospiraceae bacterium]
MGKKLTRSYGTTYSRKELTGYLVGLAGQNIIYNIIGTGLTFYFQNVIFIPAIACSVIFAVARVWDAINDPMMGSIVDKTRTKWGKCKPYLMFIPPVILITTIVPFLNGMYAWTDASGATFTASPGARVAIIGWAAVSYILWGMTYTIGDIPLWGVTSLMTESQSDRAKILSLARICASFGAIGMAFTFIAPAFTGMFTSKGMDDQHALRAAYILTAVILTVFASILFEVTGLSVHERVEQSNETHTMKENFKTMWNCLPFRQLLISGVLRSPIQLLSLVAMPLVMYYFFNNDLGGTLMTENGLNIAVVIKVIFLFVGVMGGMLVSSGVTPSLAGKIEKKKLYNCYSIIGAIPFALVFVVYYITHKTGGDLLSWPMTIIISIVFFVASWAQGGLNVLQSVMIADCVDYEEYNNGIRPDGVFFSGQSFITKLSSGIASLIYGGVSAVVGFSGDNLSILNAALLEGASFITYDGGKFATALFFCVSIPPAIGMVLSSIPTLKYALSDKEHTKMLDELNARRNAVSK